MCIQFCVSFSSYNYRPVQLTYKDCLLIKATTLPFKIKGSGLEGHIEIQKCGWLFSAGIS